MYNQLLRPIWSLLVARKLLAIRFKRNIAHYLHRLFVNRSVGDWRAVLY